MDRWAKYHPSASIFRCPFEDGKHTIKYVNHDHWRHLARCAKPFLNCREELLLHAEFESNSPEVGLRKFAKNSVPSFVWHMEHQGKTIKHISNGNVNLLLHQLEGKYPV